MAKLYAAANIRISDLIGPRLLELEAGLQIRVHEIMDHYAGEVESYAQDNAPWEDRTGEAREGLAAQVQEGVEEVELVLFNESDHGIWLEIAMNQQYEIIMPTLEHYGPIIMEALAAGILV